MTDTGKEHPKKYRAATREVMKERDVLAARLAEVEKDRRFILQERDRTFALMLVRAEAAEAALAKAREALVRKKIWAWGGCRVVLAANDRHPHRPQKPCPDRGKSEGG